MLALVALALLAQAPAAPAADDIKVAPVKWPVAEKIIAEFQRGIPPHHGSHSRGGHGKAPHAASNRVWTVKALRATFGPPTEMSANREVWRWLRADGTAVVEFRSKGYGNHSEPDSLRLEIHAAYFQPAGLAR